MKRTNQILLKKDLLKLGCLTFSLALTGIVLIVTPTLTTPILLAMVGATLLSPWVAALERSGYSRTLSITFILMTLLATFLLFGLWGIQASINEFRSLAEKTPQHFMDLINQVKNFEHDFQKRYPFLASFHLTDTLWNWGRQIGLWFLDHGPTLMGQILSWIFIVPPLVFVLLNDGRAIRNHFFQLVPNRGFESFYLVTNKIKDGISDYIQAKIIEAILLGAAVTLGLSLIGAPYTLVLGLIAGITNIIPYLGPFLGALPGLFAITLIPHSNSMILAVGLVYLIANLLDTFLIFPLVVAKLVKLHPLLLICVVAVGEQYYGLVGMLISIPVATAIKVILQEVYITVYGQSSFNK